MSYFTVVSKRSENRIEDRKRSLPVKCLNILVSLGKKFKNIGIDHFFIKR